MFLMAQTPSHSRLINLAAKAALAPLGFQQKGASRLWFADKSYWKLLVEFTPSGFSKGSYLSVGAMWLWQPDIDHNVFHYFRRLGGFVSYESDEQFAPEAHRLAIRAATEMIKLEKQFSSLEKIAAFLCENTSEYPVQIYNAAVAVALSGAIDRSRILFKKLIDQDPNKSQLWGIRKKAKLLATYLDDEARFRKAVEKIISDTRVLQRLPPQNSYF